MIDPITMHIDDVIRMCEKSKKIWGSKWRWRKEGNKQGYTWQELETKLDNIIRRTNEMKSRIKEKYEQRKSDKQLGNAGSKGKVPTTGESSDNAPIRVSGPIDGSKTRSGETEDGTPTPDGTE